MRSVVRAQFGENTFDPAFYDSSVVESGSAICLFALPAAISRSTLISAGVRASSVACSTISSEASGEIVFFPSLAARIVVRSSL